MRKIRRKTVVPEPAAAGFTAFFDQLKGEEGGESERNKKRLLTIYLPEPSS